MHRSHSLLVAWVAVSLTASPILLAQNSASGVDPSVLEAAALALQVTSIPSLWDGFAGPSEFIICPTDGGTLYALREQPQQSSGLVSLASEGFDGLYYSSARPAHLEERCFSLDYVFEGRPMLSFPQIDSVYSVGDPVEALAIALVHEEFHGYQGRFFEPTRGSGGRNLYALERAAPLPDTLIASSRFQRLAAEERRVLAEAIKASDTAEVLQLVREYVALRTRRLEHVPEELRGGEAHEERKEGTAHLVSYSLVAKATAKPASRVSELIRSDLLSTPAFNRDPAQFRHWHIYATGAGIGLVMDQLGASWRREVQEGQSLFDRLRVVVGMSGSSPGVPNKR